MSEARWYCVDSIGLATLCHDEAEARSMAEERSRAWPEGMPCRAVQLGDVAALVAERDGLSVELKAVKAYADALVSRCVADTAEAGELRADVRELSNACAMYEAALHRAYPMGPGPANVQWAAARALLAKHQPQDKDGSKT